MKKLAALSCAFTLALALPVAANAAPDGKALYSSKCAACHGADGVPKKMGEGSKALGDPAFKAASSVDSIVAITLEGKGKMKPVKSVTKEDATAIAAYILTLEAPK